MHHNRTIVRKVINAAQPKRRFILDFQMIGKATIKKIVCLSLTAAVL